MQKKKFILRLLQESIDYNACIILVCKERHVFEVNLVYLSHHWILGYLHWISVSHYGLFPLLPILGICLKVLWKLNCLKCLPPKQYFIDKTTPFQKWVVIYIYMLLDFMVESFWIFLNLAPKINFLFYGAFPNVGLGISPVYPKPLVVPWYCGSNPTSPLPIFAFQKKWFLSECKISNFKCSLNLSSHFSVHLMTNILLIYVGDDVEKSTISHTVLTCSKQHLHNTKREDLAESTGVVQAKYPPKVKLELLTTLEC